MATQVLTRPDLGAQRGLSPETLAAFRVRNTPTGWEYQSQCADGSIATRWKSYSSTRPVGDEQWKKYAWMPSKPANCRYFYPVGEDLKAAIDAEWGELWLVGGDIGVMTLYEAGIRNVTCTFGDSGSLSLDDLKALGVVRLRLLPDRDESGLKWASRIRDGLKDQLDIRLDVHALLYPIEKDHGRDSSDAWLDSDRDAERFKASLMALPRWQLPEPEAKVEPSRILDFGAHLDLPPAFVDAIEQSLDVVGHFNGDGWARKNVRCPFHDDKTPSATWNHELGILRCHTCGESFLAKRVGAQLGIRLSDFLDTAPRVPTANVRETVETAPVVEAKPASRALRPPLPYGVELTVSQREQAATGRKWLDDYVRWASEACPLTPTMFHEALALWVLATVATRRLKLTLGGEEIYPNLYILIVGVTSVYRKSTAMKQALKLLRKAHLESLLLPEDATPEALFDELAGKKPSNFDELARVDQEEWLLGRAVAAQRAIFKDECSSIFASLRKDYNAGLAELLLQGYDSDGKPLKKLLKGRGLMTVRDLSLSFLGATTPVMFAKHITNEESENGFLARFAVITPDAAPEWKRVDDVVEIPASLVDEVRRLFMDVLPWHSGQKPGSSTLMGDVVSPPVMQVYADSDAIRQIEAYRKAMTYDLITLDELGDSRAGSYARLGTMMAKVAMLLAAVDTPAGLVRVQARHAYAAQEIVERWRESLHRLDRQLARVGGIVEDKVLTYLKSVGAVGASFRDIKRDLGMKEDRRVKDALTVLGDDGQIEQVKLQPGGKKGGRPSIRYRVPQLEV